MNQNLQAVKQEITKVLRGKDECIDYVLLSLLSGGHVLLEDIPGVGKTTLAVALSKAMSFSYKRVQFTPDIMPGDILGFSMPDPVTREFKFKKGPVFTNLFLADEINRTSPKSQAALLQAMEEGCVSADGVTYQLEKPFLVIATQNPIGAAGTQKLPDSQLDRFFVRISLGYPDSLSEAEMLKGNSSANIDNVNAVLSREDLLTMQKEASEIFVKEDLYEYIVALTEKTRSHEFLLQGVSPRGSIALLKMAKAHAYMYERTFLSPDDIHAVFYSVCNHRIILNTKAKAQGQTTQLILDSVLKTVPLPKLSI